jgi:hypothetical protein
MTIAVDPDIEKLLNIVGEPKDGVMSPKEEARLLLEHIKVLRRGGPDSGDFNSENIDDETDCGRLWNECVKPYAGLFIKRNLTEDEWMDMWGIMCDRGTRKAENILNDLEHHLDGDQKQLVERGFTGLVLEKGIGNFFGEGLPDAEKEKIQVVDRGLGTGKEFNHADLIKLGIQLGIKASQWGNLPLIQMYERMGEIIGFVKIKEREISIAGVATMEVLQNKDNQDKRGVKNSNNDKKTAFKGIARLDRRLRLDELRANFPRKVWTPRVQVRP